ncbi:cupin domain-containing protein [Streptomyces sp. KL116D]|uniref:cupin domain-containing protein n=1 Tax=Streptomyces sp. KL116D TaxID=3045152 RepID=UPI003557F98F
MPVQMAGPGDFVFIPRGTRHRFKNVGDADARMLFLFTPGGHEKFFVENGDVPEAGGTSPAWGPERGMRQWWTASLRITSRSCPRTDESPQLPAEGTCAVGRRGL